MSRRAQLEKKHETLLIISHSPPFEPPAYRGVTLIAAPFHPQEAVPHLIEPRERSETMSTSSGSYASYASCETDGTSDQEDDVQMHPCESKQVKQDQQRVCLIR